MEPEEVEAGERRTITGDDLIAAIEEEEEAPEADAAEVEEQDAGAEEAAPDEAEGEEPPGGQPGCLQGIEQRASAFYEQAYDHLAELPTGVASWTGSPRK